SGVGDLLPLSGAYEQLFDKTGDISYLYKAEIIYKKGMKISAHNKDAFARGLARNYISQHRFREADSLLQAIYKEPSKKRETEMMLFDVAMELGDYKNAYTYLSQIKDLGDYNYLIRLSKWSDYKGNLNSAIEYMEKAKEIAESSGNRSLKIWTYSNLGDYYGHAGRIADAYNHYLMTLALEPDNGYVKKGIAWIAYANDGNLAEAHRVIDSVAKTHVVPDYHLFKSELYEFAGQGSSAAISKNRFISAVTKGNYGAMYNAYLIEIFSDTNPSKALELAEQEVNNRSTPESYHLLALAQLANGKKVEALSTINTYVVGKTFEPMAAYHMALVYRANDMIKELAAIKDELKESSFELGPLTYRDIENL
ncbi:MAG: tetratricopeptide repeat protein, partial [Bacteroidetes bacterium]|nr:tetratricopeptide repeat protein [Bacteroidota bacterium]